MKIFHIWNTCGLGGRLARYMDMSFDTESECIMKKDRDPFRFSNEKVRLTNYGRLSFHLQSLALSKEYEILHFHAMDRYLPHYRRLYPKKKIIMHYHGSNIRGLWDKRKHFWKHCDGILVSTRDLLEGSPRGVIHLPNIVDERLCRFNSSKKKMKGKALHCDRFALDIAGEYAYSLGLELTILNRDTMKIKHKAFIKFLSKFEYYIDVKRDTPTKSKILPELSLTGYEALMCGCKVINFNGERITEFPEENRSFNVTSKLYEIYKGLMK